MRRKADCLHCKVRKYRRPRGLCNPCYLDPAVRERYPILCVMGRPRAVGEPICQHCRNHKVNRPRGLCWTCYYTPGVKAMYPSTSKYARRGVGNFAGEAVPPKHPTTAEPGSEDKLRVMGRRAVRKEQVFHPLDRRQEESAESHRARLAGRPCEEDVASSVATRLAA